MVPVKGKLLTDGVKPQALLISSWIVPSPEPVLTVTVHDVPDPDTPVIDAPLTPPVVFNVKSAVDKPFTDAAKVAVHCIVVALVIVPLTAVRELMVVLGAPTVLEGIATFTGLALVLVNERLCPEYVVIGSPASSRT